jgi:hypothetical protein
LWIFFQFLILPARRRFSFIIVPVPVADIDKEILGGAATPDAKEDFFAFEIVAQFDSFVSVGDGFLFELKDDITLAKACGVSIGLRVDSGDESAADVIWDAELAAGT